MRDRGAEALAISCGPSRQHADTAGSRVDPATLSGGIWEALSTTAVGLAVVIAINADGTLRMEGEVLSQEEIGARMRAIIIEDNDRSVLVRAEEGVALQRTVELLGRLTVAGARNVALSRDSAP